MKAQDIFIIAEEQTYHDGQVIFEEGNRGNWIYVILRGSVEISRMTGGRKYVIEILQPGEVFGEIEFIGGTSRTLTAKSLDETIIGTIDRTMLDKEFNQLSEQFKTILFAITNRFRKMVDRASDFTSREAPRVPKSLPLVFKYHDKTFQAYTSNISTSGLFIKTENPIPPGRIFPVRLRVPNASDPIQFRCEVAWARDPEDGTPRKPSGMGVKISQITRKDYSLLKQYVTGLRTNSRELH